MPCTTVRIKNQTAEEREAEVVKALRSLEERLQAGSVTVKIGPSGAFTFAGWAEGRNDVSDLCAYRRLSIGNSFALRCAVQRAEMLAGKKISEQAIAAGLHSHDGGQTWGVG